MKITYKDTVKFILAIYVGFALANPIIHSYEGIAALRESKKPVYGPNLSRAWKDYSKSHLERLLSFKLLIPLSAIEISSPPIRVRGPENSPFQLQFDIEDSEESAKTQIKKEPLPSNQISI